MKHVFDCDSGIIQGSTKPAVNIEECLALLLYECNVNIIRTKSLAEVCEYLQNATDILAESLHRSPKHELDTVKRLPIRVSEELSEGVQQAMQVLALRAVNTRITIFDTM
jgi:hypothetical protein